MPHEHSRAERVADLLQRELAQLITERLRDPRLAMVNINAVQVPRNLAQARIYVTFVNLPDGTPADPAERVTALNRAAGFLRRALAERVQLRAIPQLRFYFDESIERARHLSALIDRVRRAETSQHEPPATQ